MIIFILLLFHLFRTTYRIFIVALRSSWYLTTNELPCETLETNKLCQTSCKKRRRLLHIEAIEQRGWRSQRRTLLEEIRDLIRTTFRTMGIECWWTGSRWVHWNWLKHFEAGLELPPGMSGISPALVTIVPGTAVAKDIPAGDTIIPGWDGSLILSDYGKSYWVGKHSAKVHVS